MKYTAEYVAEIERIAKIAQQWVKDNPDKTVQIAWRAPSADCQIIGLVGDAIKMGFVKINPAGMELLKAMGVDPGNYNEPSIMMVRAALNTLPK